MMSAVGAIGAIEQVEVCGKLGIVCHDRGIFGACIFFVELDVGRRGGPKGPIAQSHMPPFPRRWRHEAVRGSFLA